MLKLESFPPRGDGGEKKQILPNAPNVPLPPSPALVLRGEGMALQGLIPTAPPASWGLAAATLMMGQRGCECPQMTRVESRHGQAPSDGDTGWELSV